MNACLNTCDINRPPISTFSHQYMRRRAGCDVCSKEQLHLAKLLDKAWEDKALKYSANSAPNPIGFLTTYIPVTSLVTLNYLRLLNARHLASQKLWFHCALVTDQSLPVFLTTWSHCSQILILPITLIINTMKHTFPPVGKHPRDYTAVLHHALWSIMNRGGSPLILTQFCFHLVQVITANLLLARKRGVIPLPTTLGVMLCHQVLLFQRRNSLNLSWLTFSR